MKKVSITDFVVGFYSVDCACEYNITFGFELTLLKESPRNLFRFLMTRDVDIDALEGILVDLAAYLTLCNEQGSSAPRKQACICGQGTLAGNEENEEI